MCHVVRRESDAALTDTVEDGGIVIQYPHDRTYEYSPRTRRSNRSGTEGTSSPNVLLYVRSTDSDVVYSTSIIMI